MGLASLLCPHDDLMGVTWFTYIRAVEKIC